MQKDISEVDGPKGKYFRPKMNNYEEVKMKHENFGTVSWRHLSVCDTKKKKNYWNSRRPCEPYDGHVIRTAYILKFITYIQIQRIVE